MVICLHSGDPRIVSLTPLWPVKGSEMTSKGTSERSVAGAGRCGEDETCDFLWLVDLNIVPGTGNQEQLRGREQLMELPCHSFVQVGVGIAEDDPDRAGEGPQVRDHPPAADRGRQEVVIQRPERSEEGRGG